MTLPGSTQTTSFYFHPTKKQDLTRFCHLLANELENSQQRPIILLCIGTDRATGDCLGPLTGHLLCQSVNTKKVIVYGTLQQPVHAGNLTPTLQEIHNHYSNPYIIAIDASLGIPDHIGCVTLGRGSLKPGAGVSHPLPDTGDIHITGIVNALSQNNMLTLQTTRLNTVNTLCHFIATGITRALHVCTPF